MDNRLQTIPLAAILETTDALLHQLNIDSEVKAMHIARFSEARAAVAELIEADREYDLAVAAVLRSTNKPAHIAVTLIDYAHMARNRLDSAKTRRTAALAQVGAAL